MISTRVLKSIRKVQKPEEAKRLLRLDRYWRPEVVEALVARIDELVLLKPTNALGLAEVAIELLKRFRKPPAPELQAHAHSSLASAQRALGRLREAESNFLLAEKYAEGVPGKLVGMILRQKSLLYIDTGDLDQALALADRAVQTDRSAEIFPSKSLIMKGIVYYFRDAVEESLACYQEVLDHGMPNSEEYILAMNNVAAAIMKRPLLVTDVLNLREIIAQAQQRLRGIRETPVRYILWHLEGRLHWFMHEFRRATEHYQQALDGFLRLEMIPDYVRVMADHLECLVRSGQADRAEALIRRTTKRIGEFEEHKRLAEIFRLVESEPVERAAEFIRTRLATVPVEVGAD